MPCFINEQKEKNLLNLFQHKKIISLSAILLFFLFTFILIGVLTQHSVFAKEEYQLPYPGILPNHPLYFLKAGRDNLLIFFTREPMKKAQLYLLLSDKKIFMAQLIFDKDWPLVIKLINESENGLLKTKEAIEESKRQGVSSEVGFAKKCKLSAQKHEQVLKSIKKHAPKKYLEEINYTLKLNRQFADSL